MRRGDWSVTSVWANPRQGELREIATMKLERKALQVASLATSAASEAASVTPISILMLAIDSASQKTYKKTYHTPKSDF